MPGPLAPVLAQLVTLALADRIEGHYVLDTRQAHYFDSSNTTTPGASLRLDWRRASLTFSYSPTLTIVPLEEADREYLLIHRGFVDATFRWRRATLSLDENATYGKRDFAREALGLGQPPVNQAQTRSAAQPAPSPNQATPSPTTPAPAGATPAPASGQPPPGPTGTTGTGQANALTPALGKPVDYGSFRSSASFSYIESRALSYQFVAGYSVNGALTAKEQELYPLVRGPDATARVIYAIDLRDIFATALSWQLIYSRQAGQAYVATVGEDYTHRFSRELTGMLGAGVAFTRSQPANVLFPEPLYGVFPTARAAVSDAQKVGRGKLTLMLGVTATPILNTTTVTVDPSLAAFSTIAWVKDRFSTTFALASTISTSKDTRGAFNSVFAAYDLFYDIGAGFIGNAGVHGAWQSLDGETLVHPSLILYLALNWGMSEPLTTRKR